MARVVHQQTVDPEALDELLRPRHDLVVERVAGERSFEAAEGPVVSYRRTVDVGPTGADGRTTVTETTDFKLAMPVWGVVVLWPFKRALRHRHPDGKQPWWAPPDRLDRRATGVLGVLLTASLVTGYLGTLLTQTITFAADEFGADDRAQGIALAGIRTGVLISLVVMTLADRLGRRRMLVMTAGVGCVLAASGSVAPSLPWLAVAQGLARSMSIALGLLIVIVAAEEMPRNSRAYSLSVLAMASGLGAGMCLWVLPVADLGERGWRVVYLVPLLGLVLVRAVHRALPETKRFARPHQQAPVRGHGHRLLLLAASAFLLQIFQAPSSQFGNEFLRDERGFSAGGISLFTILVSTPSAIAIVVGGRLADTLGRRPVGAVGLAGGAVLSAVAFLSSGTALWLWSFLGTMIGYLTIPAVTVYGPELFPTSLRGRANGILVVAGVLGSAIGLVSVGFLSEEIDSLGGAIAVMAVFPVIVAFLVLTVYPETAHLELEDINPEDATPAAPTPAPPHTDRRPRR
ncbi:MAG: MFS transporter [Actinomycetota bacterium]